MGRSRGSQILLGQRLSVPGAGIHPPLPVCPADLQSCIVIVELQGGFSECKTDEILWNQGNTLEGSMTKYEIIYTEIALKDLRAIKRGDQGYIPKIIDKIDFCLGEHLFDSIRQCNKKKLKGKENTHRLHIQRRYTIFYTIEEAKQKQFVRIHMIIGYEAAHKKYSNIDL
ncbi:MULTISPECIES: hypothetical protein [unclassified Methanoculleus]|uniref:hypothetical protein n=1 Tax=unclassified Methanoculleus TaxID=2619537 RepID=UPI0025FD80EE|nr:hypothetical protein [Methanoculleus sp. UBA377]